MKRKFFNKSIRNRILLGILAAPALSVLIFIPWSLDFIDKTALKQMQEKVELDLNSGRVIYNNELIHVSKLVFYEALRPSMAREIFASGNEQLKEELNKLTSMEGIDILLATDNKGRVIARAGPSAVQGDDLSTDKLISKALKGEPACATDILPLERLARERNDLADQARIEILPTPRAKPKSRPKYLNSGMVIAAAQPITLDGHVVGTIYGAQLLNRNFAIVDKTRDTVYQNRLYKGRVIGTATIFQDEVRVSTNVKRKDGQRAIGTCISAEVAETCLEKGERWIGRAFVVNDWYITAYEPIYDIDENIIGILYVGILEAPYLGLRHDLFTQVVLFVLLITPFGVLVSIFISKKIVRPIKNLAQATEKIAEGDYSKRATVESDDEVGMLASSFNRMTESIQVKTRALNTAQEDLYGYSKNLEKLVKERTEKLLSTEMRYTNLFEIANDVFFTIDIHYLITSINSYGEKVLGYSKEEIVGEMHLLDIVHVDDHHRVKNKIERAIAGESSTIEITFRIQDKAGTRKILEMNVSVPKDKGTKTDILCIARDVTERRKLEDEIERTRDELQVLFNSITDGINVVDKDYTIIKANEGMAQQHGLPLETIIGRKCYKIFYNRQTPCKDCLVEKTFRTGRSSVKTQEWTRRDGAIVSADVYTFPIFDNNHTVTQVVDYFRDVTEKKALEQQLLQAQKMESVGILSGGIAHDFNNLLSGIQGCASLLKIKIAKGDPLYKYADTIEQSTVRAARLTQQLLTFSRENEARTELLDINRIIEETIQILERTIDKNIYIKKDLASHVWPLEADPSQIEQVMLNICINARDAMPNGGVLTIMTENISLDGQHIEGFTETTSGEYVKIFISDTGYGIDKQIQSKIFDPFFTTKTKGDRKGTGLGLSVVYGIIKNHGGYVSVDSEPAKGTSFHIYMPASSEKCILTDSDIMARDIVGGTEGILLVDDEEVVRNLGKDILEEKGYNVILAYDGIEAIDIYEKQEDDIALVILDMIMPRMGGMETFERLQSINPAVKVIVSSGYTSDDQCQAVLKKGVKNFIQKPYNIYELYKMVRQVLDEN